MKPGRWRIVAGSAALLLLILFAARLLPAYWRNLAFQRALVDVAQQALTSETPDDAIRVRVINAAAGMGIPVGLDQVRVRRAQDRLEIETLYVVPVALPLYSVDLHFRPRARVP
jgi:hypothetical protein